MYFISIQTQMLRINNNEFDQGLDADSIKAIQLRSEMSEEMGRGIMKNLDEKFGPILHSTAKDVTRQRERIGGDWSVAFAVFSRSQRESLRKALPGVIFIVLSLTKESQFKRLKGRHGDVLDDNLNDTFTKMQEIYEPAGDDEENAYNLIVTDDMSPTDVVQKVIEIVQ